MNAFLQKVSQIAFESFSAVGENLELLEDPYRTAVIIFSAQGVIDNGGLTYFYEQNWPNNPPYLLFADAYQSIGCQDAADALRASFNSFGINDPHKHLDLRMSYIERHFDSAAYAVIGWDESGFDGDIVWTRLSDWASKQSEFQK